MGELIHLNRKLVMTCGCGCQAYYLHLDKAGDPDILLGAECMECEKYHNIFATENKEGEGVG